MIRRQLAVSAIVPAVQFRSVYSPWHTVPHEEEVSKGIPLTTRISNLENYRHFDFFHIPVSTTCGSNKSQIIDNMSPSELYLYSAIEEDIRRLRGVDWTYDFDLFWRDRLISHQTAAEVLYKKRGGFMSLILGDSSRHTEGAFEVQKILNQLQDIVKWAEETEKCYSAIANARFKMQREVFEAFEREKILTGCVEIVEDFRNRVPAEFSRKACTELDSHLAIMRHWVWDCPNAKMTYPRILA
eukprot:Tbor_TRINITY_DN5618_c1_g5::TRINITY_DN5618_c1_g5_i1::g.8468::m.8468